MLMVYIYIFILCFVQNIGRKRENKREIEDSSLLIKVAAPPTPDRSRTTLIPDEEILDTRPPPSYISTTSMRISSSCYFFLSIISHVCLL